ncbi:MAG: hypothetical protein N3A65_04430 [candidate division WOR-3 bacterium]|nr:hypothetical protein [candidate division WOR-3 bacterium]
MIILSHIKSAVKEMIYSGMVEYHKKGLDKGFEENNTEFVFYKEPFVIK